MESNILDWLDQPATETDPFLEKRNRLLELKSELLSVEKQIQERLAQLEKDKIGDTPDMPSPKRLKTPSDVLDQTKVNSIAKLDQGDDVDELEY